LYEITKTAQSATFFNPPKGPIMMKQLKIKKDSKKAIPKMPMAKNPLKVKTNVKAGSWDWLWAWPTPEETKD
jgi:hypothetical protein